jgi:hypothetical protein
MQKHLAKEKALGTKTGKAGAAEPAAKAADKGEPTMRATCGWRSPGSTSRAT